METAARDNVTTSTLDARDLYTHRCDRGYFALKPEKGKSQHSLPVNLKRRGKNAVASRKKLSFDRHTSWR
jgi:hypothetical protein